MTKRLGTLLCGLLFCSAALAECPDDAADLVSWTTQIGTTSPQDEITISSPVLLDTSVELLGLTIASGGRLVWSRAGDYGMRSHYIKIQNGGELHIGSPTCRFGKKARITLLGEPEEKLNIPGFGEKFLGVEAGGVLNLYGREKLSWTKLTKHVPKFDEATAEIFNHKDSGAIERGHGFYIYHFREDFPADFDIEKDPGIVYVNRIHKSLKSSSQDNINTAISELATFLNNIPVGDIFVLATQRDYKREDKDYTTLFDALDLVAPVNSLRNVQPDDAYVALGKKGDQASFKEDLDSTIGPDNRTEALLVYSDDSRERELVVSTYNGLEPWQGSLELFVFNTLLTRPIISVVNNVNSWKTGDKIFVASTDYDWRQVEEFEVIPCNNVICSSNTVRLSHPFKYDHYGEIYNRVDMRAEVGLMTRNILIDAEVSEGNSNGGHVKFLHGFKDVQVDGVELTNLGQPLILGRYPLHYHMCEDLSDTSVYPTRSVLRKNSIHHTQFRCVTIHGTHSARLIDNVCYDSVGHGFFLEDGGEKNTYFRGNLGLGQRRFVGTTVLDVTGAIPTDTSKGPATFWITNPLTTVLNNAAAGGEGVGMWFVYPDSPTGPSRARNFMQDKEARHTKITLYKNNVHHSYTTAGLFVDNIEHDDLTVSDYNKYNPKQNPLDPSSAPVPAVFERATVYKNRGQNMWVRGTPIIVRESSFADSQVGATVIKEQDIWVEFINNVVIGYSDNLGKPNTGYTRSYPSTPSRDVVGFRFNKGPVFVKNTWFHDFVSTDIHRSAAMSNFECFGHMNPQNQVENVLFSFDDGPGNRFLFRECQSESSTTANTEREEDSLFMLKDIGNGLTGHSTTKSVTLVKNTPFLVTSQCRVRDSWNVAYCPYNYGEIMVSFSDEREMSVYRTDGALPKKSVLDKEFITILGETNQNQKNFLYLIAFDDGLPQSVTFKGKSITKSDSVIMAYCVPRDALLSVRYKIGGISLPTQPVCSLGEIQQDTEGGKYFYDKNVGVLFFKMINDVEYTTGEKASCPSGKCVRFGVTILSGTLTDSDCYDRFILETSYVHAAEGSPGAANDVLLATTPQAPEHTLCKMFHADKGILHSQSQSPLNFPPRLRNEGPHPQKVE
uniref:Transmembrane protein 2 n=1 Tax=Magallana gigas TaxID=29159 RepID=K1PJF5_MAGGI